MVKYVGCKVDRNKRDRYIKLTQPVMKQSFEDDFDLKEGGHQPKTPAETGLVLNKKDDVVSKKEHKQYQTGVGKLLHMMQYSKPE
eukprot:560521-Ditylum_brightwellii.AAC.1